MIGKLFVLLCVVAAALAYPYPYPYPDSYPHSDSDFYPYTHPDTVGPIRLPFAEDGVRTYDNADGYLVRQRRQLQLQGGGGGSPGKGFDFALNGKVPVWQSNNGNHQVAATGQYAQHLGGPYGSSRPNWGAGVGYTFKF